MAPGSVRYSESFRKSRLVKLVSGFFTRRRPKKFKISSISVSSPQSASNGYPTMSLALRCRYLKSDRPSSQPDELLSSGEWTLRKSEHRDVSCSPLQSESDIPQHRSVSLESVLHAGDDLTTMKPSRPKSSVYGTASSSLVDISNAALRTELESKMFVRAKRLNSASDDPSDHVPVRLRVSNATSVTQHVMSNSLESNSSLFTYTRSSETATNVMEESVGIPALTPALTHEAAKHKIAVKPKNRRPKSSYQTVQPSKLSPIASTSQPPEFNRDITIPIPEIPSKPTLIGTVSVVSETESHVEIIQTSAESSPVLETPVRPPRKLSGGLSYSKSFHFTRRPTPESEPKPVMAKLSPSVENRAPKVPPKPALADSSDEFMKLMSKFRRKTDLSLESSSPVSGDTFPTKVTQESQKNASPVNVSLMSSQTTEMRPFVSATASSVDISGGEPVGDYQRTGRVSGATSGQLSPVVHRPLADCLPAVSKEEKAESRDVDKVPIVPQPVLGATSFEEQSAVVNKFIASNPFKNDFLPSRPDSSAVCGSNVSSTGFQSKEQMDVDENPVLKPALVARRTSSFKGTSSTEGSSGSHEVRVQKASLTRKSTMVAETSSTSSATGLMDWRRTLQSRQTNRVEETTTKPLSSPVADKPFSVALRPVRSSQTENSNGIYDNVTSVMKMDEKEVAEKKPFQIALRTSTSHQAAASAESCSSGSEWSLSEKSDVPKDSVLEKSEPVSKKSSFHSLLRSIVTSERTEKSEEPKGEPPLLKKTERMLPRIPSAEKISQAREVPVAATNPFKATLRPVKSVQPRSEPSSSRSESDRSDHESEKSTENLFGFTLRKTGLKVSEPNSDRSSSTCSTSSSQLPIPPLRKTSLESKKQPESASVHSEPNKTAVVNEEPVKTAFRRSVLLPTKAAESKSDSHFEEAKQPALPSRVVLRPRIQEPRVIASSSSESVVKLPVLKPVNSVQSSNAEKNEKPAVVPPMVSLKPVVPLRTTNGQKLSCGAAASSVPSWVSLAQEKRNRISMLHESGDKENSGVFEHAISASYA